jgi:uncharacterized membrane protein
MELRRTLRHWLTLPGQLRRAFPESTLRRIREEISASEAHHSGEIRFAVEAALPSSYLWRDAPARERALSVFGKLRVWDTEHNNGVLIYVLVADHRVELIADRGIARLVGDDQWKAIARAMREHFRAGAFEQGALEGVRAVGALLQQHYPLAAGERSPDELPDAPVVL